MVLVVELLGFESSSQCGVIGKVLYYNRLVVPEVDKRGLEM